MLWLNKGGVCIILTQVFRTSFPLKFAKYNKARLTVKLIEDLRHPFFRLNSVDQRVFIIHSIHDAHVIVIVPN